MSFIHPWRPGAGHDPDHLRSLAMLLRGSRVLLTTHTNPDGDAFGSLLGLAGLLRELSGDVWLYLAERPGNADFAFLHGYGAIRYSLPADRENWLPVLVDCHTPERAGDDFARWVGAGRYVAFDHHLADGETPDTVYIRSAAASATMVVGELAVAAGIEVTEEVAACLYTGLLTDTGYFCHGNTNGEVFAFARSLVEQGARPAEIAARLQATMTPARLRLTARAIDSLRTSETTPRWASLRIARQDFRDCGANESDASGLIDLIRNLRGVEIAFVVRELEEGVKVSLRSRPPWDVRSVAVRYGGGGHKHAAGVRFDTDMETAHATIVAALEELNDAL